MWWSAGLGGGEVATGGTPCNAREKSRRVKRSIARAPLAALRSTARRLMYHPAFFAAWRDTHRIPPDRSPMRRRPPRAGACHCQAYAADASAARPCAPWHISILCTARVSAVRRDSANDDVGALASYILMVVTFPVRDWVRGLAPWESGQGLLRGECAAAKTYHARASVWGAHGRADVHMGVLAPSARKGVSADLRC